MGRAAWRRAAWRRPGSARGEKKAPASEKRPGARKERPAARCSPALLGAVPSPRGPLTAVFGKGTGVEAPPRPPVMEIGNGKRKTADTKAARRGSAGARRRARVAFQ